MRTAITEETFERVRVARHTEPDSILAALRGRKRRSLTEGDGRLMIVAADHPARGALAVGTDNMAMGDRYDLLQRVVVALARPGVDGVLGTPDILEDLALLGALDGKIAVGSMNRGGLRGASFEMDDRFTGYDIDSIESFRLDAAKLLVRVNLHDSGTASTLEQTARAISASARARIPIMIEPFMSEWVEGRVVNRLTADAVITSVAIASGLGVSSAYSWLKLPVVDDMERVMASTTLPTLLLGGDSGLGPDETFASWQSALTLPGVHGLVVGRTLLYPKDGDVESAVDIAARLVHGEQIVNGHRDVDGWHKLHGGSRGDGEHEYRS